MPLDGDDESDLVRLATVRTALTTHEAFAFVARARGVLEERPAIMGVVCPGDQSAAIEAVGTTGVNHGMTNEAVVLLIATWEQRYGAVLLSAAADAFMVQLGRRPEDPERFVTEQVGICPDIQWDDDIEGLTRTLIETGRVRCSWD